MHTLFHPIPPQRLVDTFRVWRIYGKEYIYVLVLRCCFSGKKMSTRKLGPNYYAPIFLMPAEDLISGCKLYFNLNPFLNITNLPLIITKFVKTIGAHSLEY